MISDASVLVLDKDEGEAHRCSSSCDGRLRI